MVDLFRRLILTGCILILSCLTSFAQLNTCTVKAYLLDSLNAAPLIYARISSVIQDPSTGIQRQTIALSNSSGYFEIETAAGSYLEVQIENSRVRIPVENTFCEKINVLALALNYDHQKEAIITGLRDDKPRQRIPASIGLIDGRQLRSNDQTSMQQNFNSIPGVIMESRGYGGSHRLSIRGSSLRSPFAVRNIKMYVDGVPMTSPDGQVPLEWIDPANIESAEIIKGPAGSIRGSGNGGVILFNTRHAIPGKIRTGAGMQVASYESYRSHAFASIGGERGGFHVSHTWQDNGGYREQEFNQKNQVLINYIHYLPKDGKIFASGGYYRGRWGLPGALKSSEVEENPRMALPFSLKNNAYLQRERLFSSFSYQQRFGLTQIASSVYVYTSDKTNPFGTSAFNKGYKDESADGFGGRLDLTRRFISSDNLNVEMKAGGEWQAEKFNILEKDIVNSQPGDFRYTYDIGYTTAMAFASLDVTVKKVLLIQAGASYNTNQQDVRGFNTSDFAFDTLANWQSQVLPRVAVSFNPTSDFTLYFSHAAGNANPTVFEMIDYETNSYHLNLQPEKGLNQELGIRTTIPTINVFAEISAYRFELKDAILPQAILDANGNPLDQFTYRNAGETIQQGLEWSLRRDFEVEASAMKFFVSAAGSLYRYRFGAYEVEGVQNAGKTIPGVPMANASNSFGFSWKEKLVFDAQHIWFDRIALNNANTLWSNPYHLLNLRASYRLHIGPTDLVFSAGVNNLLNADYSSYFALNASNGRYYNPSPPINYYGGLAIEFVR